MNESQLLSLIRKLEMDMAQLRQQLVRPVRQVTLDIHSLKEWRKDLEKRLSTTLSAATMATKAQTSTITPAVPDKEAPSGPRSKREVSARTQRQRRSSPDSV